MHLYFDRCRICRKTDPEEIKLRDGSIICRQCIDDSKSALIELKKRKHQAEVSPNIWDKIAFFSILILIIFALYLWSFSFIYVAVALPPIYFIWVFSHSKSKLLRIETLMTIDEEKESIKMTFLPIFDLFWSYPPDWAWRRGQVRERDNRTCKNCNRKWFGSSMPFHVHHVIPISNAESSHKLENLVFLCELCHSQVDDLHSLVKIARQERLNKIKSYGKRYSKRNWNPPVLEKISVYW